MAEISTEEKHLMASVEDAVCSYFDVSVSKVVSKDLKNESVMARNYIFYILHHDLRISVSKIAYEYSRQERSVKAQVAKMRVCVKSNKVYKTIHDTLLESITKGGK